MVQRERETCVAVVCQNTGRPDADIDTMFMPGRSRKGADHLTEHICKGPQPTANLSYRR